MSNKFVSKVNILLLSNLNFEGIGTSTESPNIADDIAYNKATNNVMNYIATHGRLVKFFSAHVTVNISDEYTNNGVSSIICESATGTATSDGSDNLGMIQNAYDSAKSAANDRIEHSIGMLYHANFHSQASRPQE